MRYLVECNRYTRTVSQYIVEAQTRTAAKAAVRSMTPAERERAMIGDDCGAFKVVSEVPIRAVEDEA